MSRRLIGLPWFTLTLCLMLLVLPPLLSLVILKLSGIERSRALLSMRRVLIALLPFIPGALYSFIGMYVGFITLRGDVAIPCLISLAVVLYVVKRFRAKLEGSAR